VSTHSETLFELDDPSSAAIVNRLIREGASAVQIAAHTGSSHAAVMKWSAGSAEPNSKQRATLIAALETRSALKPAVSEFQSHGSRLRLKDYPRVGVEKLDLIGPGPIDRVLQGSEILIAGSVSLSAILERHHTPAKTAVAPPTDGISAGKNTYTYDAHTYHTKVPPQGIAELLRYYLPEGGLVADPFGGSGMTSVAASAVGIDSVLNELSPAAAFIASRFTSSMDPGHFASAVSELVEGLSDLRRTLYTTECRECQQLTEILYTVWSYRVICPHCANDFQLWDVARSYGDTVRDHKILRTFPCPACNEEVQKSRLTRTYAEPVQLGYKCCTKGRLDTTVPLTKADHDKIRDISDLRYAATDVIPQDKFPAGVNLRQPIRHGIDSLPAIYTTRNLTALSRIWERTLLIADDQLAAQVAFVFTSLYRRVSKFSEFRFWGGSGNAARLNVPFIYDEANVFLSYLRKAQTILDHMQTTGQNLTGQRAVTIGSATDLRLIPDSSVDLIFTDPPFGANINYSDMNFIWESWLGRFTDTTDEAIVNKVQEKSLDDYETLMRASFSEAFRVLRDKHWMLVVFMNSSAEVWDAINRAIRAAGFKLVKADIFDKQHGTVKEFESANTAGADLVIHCVKDTTANAASGDYLPHSPEEFARSVVLAEYQQRYIHVNRVDEFNYRRLYSEWLGQCVVRGGEAIDFVDFKDAVRHIVEA
jgi:DNA modification methylase